MNHHHTIALYQPLLHAIAYNLVQCRQDAEDIVQDTFLRCLVVNPEKIENLKAYLIKSVINNCRNHLQTLRRKKEELFSQTNLTDIMNRFKESNVAHLDLDTHLSAALKVVLTKLEPLERAVYLLREVFDFDYETLQDTLDKKKEHCRQLFLRAKRKLQKSGKEPQPAVVVNQGWKELFQKACLFGYTDELIFALKADISKK